MPPRPGRASGLSIDQEIKNKLQAEAATRTRFGSLEFGVLVPERADTWTRMVYSGPNKPVTPIDDPYQMFSKLYGRTKDRETPPERPRRPPGRPQDDRRDHVSVEDRQILDEHATFVRDMERDLSAPGNDLGHAVPDLEAGVKEQNDSIPKISKMQIDLMVNSFAADFARVATLQYTNSVGGARMRWIGVDEGHHELSHNPDSDEKSVEKLTKINKWYCEQLAYMAQRLAETPSRAARAASSTTPRSSGPTSWAKGTRTPSTTSLSSSSATGLDFKMGRALKFSRVPHNRLLVAMAQGMGHNIDRFGNPDFCGDGPLSGLV